MRKPIVIVIGILIMGILASVGGFRQFAQRDKYDTTVQATVVDIQLVSGIGDDPDKYEAYIDYEYDGKTYEHVEYPDDAHNLMKGDQVEIKLMSEDPEQIGTGNMGAKGIIAGVAGIVLILAGTAFVSHSQLCKTVVVSRTK